MPSSLLFFWEREVRAVIWRMTYNWGEEGTSFKAVETTCANNLKAKQITMCKRDWKFGRVRKNGGDKDGHAESKQTKKASGQW